MTTVSASNTAEGGIAPQEEEDARILGLFTPTGLAMTITLGVVFVGLFYRWFRRQFLVESWRAPEDWGHAYIIPFISAYLIWQHRERLRRVTKHVFWPGLIPFTLGIVAYYFGLVGVRNHMLEGFSMLLTLFGLVLMLLGPGAMRHLFLPIAYLVFAVTISDRIMLEITFMLQLVASQGSWVLLNIIGAPLSWFSAEVSGNTLTLVTRSGELIPLNVAEACSGMRMVVAFFALAGAVALLACRDWWQRIALMLLAAPVAILMNIIRVAALGIASLYNPELAVGDAHMLIGTLLLVPGLMLFLGVLWALNRIIEEPAEAGVRKGAGS